MVTVFMTEGFMDSIRKWRNWFPIPTADRRFHIVRWILLEANRFAVVGALLSMVFVSLMVIGSLWTFEMQSLLEETSTVQLILDTLLNGIILLVSIVVSINAIVLSHEMTSIDREHDRIAGTIDFRQELGNLSKTGESPSDPAAFLELMARQIEQRARTLEEDVEGVEAAFAEDVRGFVTSIEEMVTHLDEIQSSGAQFGVLWKGMEVDYGPHADRSRALLSSHDNTNEQFQTEMDDLVDILELFAVGKEYFKTLYYQQEVSRLSQSLLVISLPAIVLNATTILAIDAGTLPDVWVFGLPPLQSFVFFAFSASLVPYLLLTSYMLRLSTVARQTSSGGVFSFR